MKILVLQLARFGDIYQSWPALRALRRTFPAARITLVVREKFKAATEGLGATVDEVRLFDTAKILSPILFQIHGIDDSLGKLTEFIAEHEAQNYDRIINLSFSPASSFLVDAIAGENTQVSGYRRHTDGFLSIPDDASAYFYAQVGVDRWNRIHLTDLFALIAGVELKEEDWRAPELPPTSLPAGDYVVLQAGASQAEKTLSATQWKNTVDTLLHETKFNVVIVGGGEDRARFEWPVSKRVVDLTGRTKLLESMAIIAGARALIAPDSVCLHMASLTGTPTFNVSLGPVRFWETGPRAPGSCVWRLVTREDYTLGGFWTEFALFLNGKPSCVAYTVQPGNDIAYTGRETSAAEEFQWRLTQALYMQSDYPAAPDPTALHAFQRVGELAELGLEQVENVRRPASRALGLSILDEIDHLLEKVSGLDARVAPLVNWFLTQKLRIGPGDVESVLNETKRCFEELRTITQVYATAIRWDETLQRKDLTWKS